MRWLASLLLVVLIGTHYGYDLLAGLYPHPAAAARAWFYVLRGFEGSVLYLIVWYLTPYRPLPVRYAVSLVCAWGALESIQTSVCRLVIGIEAKPNTGLFAGLCDVVTGWPIYMLTLLVVIMVTSVRNNAGRKHGCRASD